MSERPRETALAPTAASSVSIRFACAVAVLALAAAAAQPPVAAMDLETLVPTRTAHSDLDTTLGRAQALATADFDEDGVPDLVVAYEGGIASLHRGNAHAIWGFTAAALELKSQGRFNDSAFLTGSLPFDLGSSDVDLLGAGDFDADGHFDLVAGSVGGGHLLWLRGDGTGALGSPSIVNVQGTITALTVGEINRRDGLADVVVGLTHQSGFTLEVFEGPEGAFRGPSETTEMPGPVTDLTLRRLDQAYGEDLAVASGGELIFVSGRDRALSTVRKSRVAPATATRLILPFWVSRLAAGDLAGDWRQDLALYGEDGSLSILEATDLAAGLAEGVLQLGSLSRLGHVNGTAPDLVVGRLSGEVKQSLLTLSSTGADAFQRNDRSPLTSMTGTQALGMRLDRNALTDFVLIDPNGKVVIERAPEGVIFTVNSVGDASDNNVGDGNCDTGGLVGIDPECTLRASIEEANSAPAADTIEFAIPGGGPHSINPPTDLPAITASVTIDGYSQPGAVQADATNPATLQIDIEGSDALFEGFSVTGGSVTIRGLAIGGFTSVAIRTTAPGSIFEGNYMGLDITGMSRRSGATGVLPFTASPTGVQVGGPVPAARNLFSRDGLRVYADGGFFQGNYVGLTATGTALPADNGIGLSVEPGGTNLTLGGSAAGAGNVIGNMFIGVSAKAAGLVLQGNLVGTDPMGTTPFVNQFALLVEGNNVTIGGTTASARNVLSASQFNAVTLRNSDGGLIQGNYVGTAADGVTALGNGDSGVIVQDAVSNATVGGTVAAAANLIAYNSSIGAIFDGGVAVIDDFGTGTPTNISILGNSIFADAGIGIDLCADPTCDGVTANDSMDPDSGTNEGQNYPDLTTADADSGVVSGTLDSVPSTTFRVEFFGNSECDASGFGEGETFLGADDTVTTNASGIAAFSSAVSQLLAGLQITTTATDPNGNTSEFSQCVTATGEANLEVSKDDGATDVAPGQAVVYTIVVGNPVGPAGAAGVGVDDVVPSELIDCSWTCIAAGGATCKAGPALGDISDIIDLPVGGTATYTLACTVDPTAMPGPLANTVALTLPPSVSDPDTGNNTSTDTNTILGSDYGDAPDPTYPTLMASDGARHTVMPGFHLGAAIDDETDGQPSAMADGDDNDGTDDEDGVAFGSLVAGGSSAVDVTASAAGLLNAWIDFNADGDWLDAGEQVFVDQALAPGVNMLIVAVPLDSTLGSTVARFRFDSGGGLAPTGAASDGEVEDYVIVIAAETDLAVAASDSADPLMAGEDLTYTIDVSNLGPSNSTGSTLTFAVPAEGSFLSSTPGTPDCVENAGVVTCSLPPLSLFASTQVEVLINVPLGVKGIITGSAQVVAAEADPNAPNDLEVEETEVLESLVLFEDDFESGDTSAWSVVVN